MGTHSPNVCPAQSHHILRTGRPPHCHYVLTLTLPARSPDARSRLHPHLLWVLAHQRIFCPIQAPIRPSPSPRALQHPVDQQPLHVPPITLQDGPIVTWPVDSHPTHRGPNLSIPGHVPLSGPSHHLQPDTSLSFASNHPLTRRSCLHHLRRLLRASNHCPGAYNTHSFRIGAATMSTSAGISSSVIKHLGRWRSNAYQHQAHR